MDDFIAGNCYNVSIAAVNGVGEGAKTYKTIYTTEQRTYTVKHEAKILHIEIWLMSQNPLSTDPRLHIEDRRMILRFICL